MSSQNDRRNSTSAHDIVSFSLWPSMETHDIAPGKFQNFEIYRAHDVSQRPTPGYVRRVDMSSVTSIIISTQDFIHPLVQKIGCQLQPTALVSQLLAHLPWSPKKTARCSLGSMKAESSSVPSRAWNARLNVTTVVMPW